MSQRLELDPNPNTNSQIAEVRLWVLGFAQQLGMRRGGRTWWVLVAGDGPSEDLGAAAAVVQSSPRERKRAHERNGRRKAFF